MGPGCNPDGIWLHLDVPSLCIAWQACVSVHCLVGMRVLELLGVQPCLCFAWWAREFDTHAVSFGNR